MVYKHAATLPKEEGTPSGKPGDSCDGSMGLVVVMKAVETTTVQEST